MVYVENRLDSPTNHTLPDAKSWLLSLSGQYSEQALTVLRRACEMAYRVHGGQLRVSGEPYFHHVLAVADILVSLKLDYETITAAILHDTVEDTEVTLEDIEQDFSSSVARLVDGATRIDFIQTVTGGTQQAENLRKLLLAMAEDVRVVLIKLADRLHNMRTLKHLPVEKQRRIARETLEIYAPLANRLGIWHLKWELEDLSFRYLEPQSYRKLAYSLHERRIEREHYIEQVINQLSVALVEAGIKAEVTGRPKHIYSIWRKIQRKGIELEQLYDLRAVRILVDEVTDCYHALGIVHSLWSHIPGEFDDYIATPKENYYQSIHTAVIGPQGKTLEVQIRTHKMHQHAELGVAAHWIYKEGSGTQDGGFEQKIAWLRQLLEWKDESHDADDFIDRFKSELFQDRVYVLTPQGKILDLPQGSTPLDFAYTVHTEVGHCCRGAKVDGRIVPLTYELQSGQQVEILTTRHGAPSRDWLNWQLGYVKSSRARSKILTWFKQQDQDKHISEGKLALERELRRLGTTDLKMDKLVTELKFQEHNELLAAVGRGEITIAQIAGAVHRLLPPVVQHPVEVKQRRSKELQSGRDIQIQGVGNLLTHMAQCCKPVPGDAVIGYITLGRGVSIHRRDCSNILNLNSDKRQRLVEVEWGYPEPDENYQVNISLRAIDRSGLLRDVTTVLAAENVNVLEVNTLTNPKNSIATMELKINIHDTTQLSKVLNRIDQLPNVLEVWRHS